MSFLLRDSTCKILKEINNNGSVKYGMQISRKVGLTVSTVHHRLKELENMELLQTNKSERQHSVTLTAKGLEVFSHLQAIKDLVNEN